MVTLRIVNLDLGSKVTHDATDWQIATDPLFEDIIFSSMEDTKNLTFITWDEVLDPTVKYYARARVLLSTGYTIWGNIDVFTPYDINDIEIDVERPTKVTNPILSTGYDANKHPNALFTITASNYSSTSSATLESTTWMVEDIEGKLIYLNENDRINKTSLVFNRHILKSNQAYRIKAMFKASSGDVSSFGTKTIVINPYSKISLKTSLSNVLGNEDLHLEVNQVRAVSKTQWELYVVTDNNVVKIWDDDTDSPYEAYIDKKHMVKDRKYILRYRCNLDEEDVWSYEVFYIYKDKE